VGRRGVRGSTFDNHRQPAFRTPRDALAFDGEVSTGVDRAV
jgi:hypothetical protein